MYVDSDLKLFVNLLGCVVLYSNVCIGFHIDRSIHYKHINTLKGYTGSIVYRESASYTMLQQALHITEQDKPITRCLFLLTVLPSLVESRVS